jgi:hypothetical protein
LYATRIDAYRLAHVRICATAAMAVPAVVEQVIAALQQRSLVDLRPPRR